MKATGTLNRAFCERPTDKFGQFEVLALLATVEAPRKDFACLPEAEIC